MNKNFLLLLASIMFTMALISCIDPPSSFVKITNNSERNITWVVIVDMKTGYAVANEKGNELIAKNGGSNSFEPSGLYGSGSSGKYIACVKAEEISDFMCTATFTLKQDDDSKAFVWNGSGDSVWQAK